MSQNVHMPNGRNAISNLGQQALGNVTTQITAKQNRQTKIQGVQFIIVQCDLEDMSVGEKSANGCK